MKTRNHQTVRTLQHSYPSSLADFLKIKAALTNNPGLSRIRDQPWFDGFKKDMEAKGLEVDYETGSVKREPYVTVQSF